MGRAIAGVFDAEVGIGHNERYWTTTGTKTDRRVLARMSKWPSLDATSNR